METMTDPAAELTVAAYPGLVPRLIGDTRPESLIQYVEAGGYAALADPSALLDATADSGLRGRGGAAFPMAIKIRAVRDCARGGRPIVVANGEEGEPASIKDRWLQRNRPHLVLDGLRLAAIVTDARCAFVYVSDESATGAIASALAEARQAGLLHLPVELKVVYPGYIAGEETAAVRAINGGPAKPTDKPPRPFDQGVFGQPTLVSNVETLANLPFLQQHGAVGFREVGTQASPGTFLATVTGAKRPPALYELPHGIHFRDLLTLHGVTPENVRGVLMGGYFSGLLNSRALDMTLDHEGVRALGSGLGCGALCLLTQNECPVAAAASVMAYFAAENAGQCGSCFNGTAAMSAVIEGLRDGIAGTDDVKRLRRWSVVLRGRGACGTLDGATNLAASLLAEFPEDVDQHLNSECDSCATSPYQADRPFEVEAVSLV